MALYHYSIKLSPEVGLSPAVFLLSILVSIIDLPIEYYIWIVLIPTKVILQSIQAGSQKTVYFEFIRISLVISLAIYNLVSTWTLAKRDEVSC